MRLTDETSATFYRITLMLRMYHIKMVTENLLNYFFQIGCYSLKFLVIGRTSPTTFSMTL